MSGLYWKTRTDTVAADQDNTLEVQCPYGEVYGGGVWVENPDNQQAIAEDAPSGDLTAWYIKVENNDLAHSYTIEFYALCGPSYS